MAKIVLNDVTNISSLSVINANFDKIEQTLQDEVFFRDNVSGETNTIQQDVDFNGFTLLNVGGTVPSLDSFPGKYLGVFATDPTVTSTGAAVSEGMLYFRTGSPFQAMMVYTSSGWVEASPTSLTITTSIDPSLFASDLEVAGGTITGKVISPQALQNGLVIDISKNVDNISALKALDKTLVTVANTKGYYVPGDNGSGIYWYDSSDVISVDNGGTVIVATDGGRWKLLINGEVTVRQFGAKGDNASDDTLAIQSAINALSVTGGKVHFSPGIYRSNRLTIRNSNIQLIGVGRASWLRWTGVPGLGIFGGTQGFITAYPSDSVYPGTPGTALTGIKIEDLRITGQNEATYTAGRQGILFENVSGGYIAGCLIEEFGAETVIVDAALGGSKNIVVENNEINKGFNYWNPGNSPACVFHNNYCHDQLGQGCEVRGTGNKVTSNHFKNSGTITLLSDFTASERGGIIFSNNTLESCGKVELNTQTGSQITNVVVEGNTFWKGTAISSLLVRGGASTDCRVLVKGNIFTEQVSGCAIELIGGYGGMIIDNIIYPGPSGAQTRGIVGDVNAKAHIYDNHVTGHSILDIDVTNSRGYVGTNITGSIVTPVAKSNMYQSTLAGETGGISLTNDSVIDLATNTSLAKSATSGMLMVNIRSSTTTTGRNLLSSFVAHVSGGGHHTAISSTGGPTPGSALNVVNTLLTGTSGAAGTISVSVVSGTAGAWRIQVENRSGASIFIGWQIMGVTL